MVEDLEVKILDGMLRIEINDGNIITYPANSVNKEPILSFRDGMKELGSFLYRKEGDLWKPLMSNLDLEFGKGSDGYKAFERIISEAKNVQGLFESTLERYIINENEGTVLDTTTDLLWDYDWTQEMTWDKAVKHVKSKGNGWSLSTKVQLKSLGDYEECYPTPDELEDIGFKLPNKSFLPVWTSEEYNVGVAWLVSFNFGLYGNYDDSNPYYVVCVRKNS